MWSLLDWQSVKLGEIRERYFQAILCCSYAISNFLDILKKSLLYYQVNIVLPILKA